MTTILVVDDHWVTQRILAHVLRKSGHSVVTAFNGREALARLGEGEVDLAFIDLTMPEMDGLTLLRILRADVRWAVLPVVMLTASGQDEDRLAAHALGANEFLTKPVSSWQLLASLERLLA